MNSIDSILLTGRDKEALDIVDELDKLSQDKYFGALYDASIVQKKMENSAKEAGYRESMTDGVKCGIEQGSLNKSIEIAKSMLNKNIDIKVISECTGLTIEQTEDMKNN